ncbi:MAG: chromosomal replication initiator protein DnaA [Firmicutes bacterium]|nr:chromosomal replication initiator protein DnaA [Bacillota bacterium]
MESFAQAWELVLDVCKNKITDIAFKTWISKIIPHELDLDNRSAFLIVPNDFFKNTIENCYESILKDSLEHVFGIKLDIKISTKNNLSPQIFDTKDFYRAFSFENYIVGPSNKFAHAAALAVSSHLAGAYNPLFIYGSSGLGKTHLLYAIRNEVHRKNVKLISIYIKGDDFTNELIDSIRRGTTIDFHMKYRKADLLLVDDIQFIAGKNSTQEEFFHTFNALYEDKKQIVLTSDRPPKEIQTLEDRLRTRFEWGLIADIQPPDFETRIAIIKRKSEILDIDIPDNICEIMAERLNSNIRQLEGAVKKIKARTLLSGESITVQTAQAAIADVLNSDYPTLPMTVDKIVEEVALNFSIKPEDIRSSKRSALISKARQISIYIVRKITKLPLATIGKYFGGRDHSTVVYASSQIENDLLEDTQLQHTVENIVENIKRK